MANISGKQCLFVRTMKLCQGLNVRMYNGSCRTICCSKLQSTNRYQLNYKSSGNPQLLSCSPRVSKFFCFDYFPSRVVKCSKKFETVVFSRHFASSSNVSQTKQQNITNRDKASTKINSTSLSVKSRGAANKLLFDPNDWEVVYRFVPIRVARVIQRLKIMQTAITCCLVLPGSIGLFITEAMPAENLLFVFGVSTFACVMLYVMGTMCSRLIGAIYVSKADSTMIRIAHMNFWGSREDQIFSRNEIVPFSEIPDNVSDIYVNVKFYSDPNAKLHLSLRYGTVCNKFEFEDIFGETVGMSITPVQTKSKK